MPIDFLGTARSTALITLVAASFSTPVVAKSGAFDQVSSRFGGGAAQQQAQEPGEVLLAGGIEYELPASWDRLGASAAMGDDEAATQAERISAVVSAVCPGGSSGGACADDAKLTFLTYSGRDGHQLPTLAEFEGQLDERLKTQYHGFAKGESRMRSGADGIRFLDYSFTWDDHGTEREQRLAAYRSTTGSGVVIVGTGAKLDAHAKELDAFLSSAHEPLSDQS